MVPLRLGVTVLAMSLLAGGWIMGDNNQKSDDKKDPPPKLKGTLPQGWGKLGLTADQKQKIYKVQADYRVKIEALERQLELTKKNRREEMEKVLTKEQMAQLRKEALPEKDKDKDKDKDKAKDKDKVKDK